MELFAAVFAIALIVEALVQVLKAGVPDTINVPAWLWPVCSAALGMLLCVLAKVDALDLLGISLSLPIVGSLLTGLLVSRGASFIHDLWMRIKGDGSVNTDQ